MQRRLLVVGLMLAATAAGRTEEALRSPALDAAMDRLSTLHLFRGLQLDRSQLQALETLAQAAVHHRRARAVAEAGPAEALREQIDRYAQALLDGTTADGLGNPVADPVYAGTSEERARANAWLARLARLEAQARGVLSPEQVRIVEGFTRCVISPGYLADPERIGQAGKTSNYLERLREVRRMDATEWSGRRAAWIEEWLAGVEGEVGPLGAERRARLGDRFALVFEDARRLDRLAFTLRGPELAKFLDFEVQEQEHLRDLAGAIRSRQGGPGPIARWLLSDAALGLYPRLAAAKAPDLRGLELPVAARCVKGAACATTTFANLFGARPELGTSP